MLSLISRTVRRPAVLAATLALAALAGCSTEPDDPGGGGVDNRRTFVITYSAVATGDGQFDWVRYDNGLGRIIDVITPGKTWNVQIQMREGETVFLESQGAAGNGTLTIAITGDDGLGHQVTLSDDVTGDGTVTTYMLSVAQQTLP